MDPTDIARRNNLRVRGRLTFSWWWKLVVHPSQSLRSVIFCLCRCCCRPVRLPLILLKLLVTDSRRLSMVHTWVGALEWLWN